MSNKRTHRVLLVDDDVDLLRALAQTLATQGFLCDRAANGADASAMLAENDYEVLITDLRMPMLNGHALSVNMLTRRPRPLVVVLTGIIEPRLAADLLIRGVDDVVFKPVHSTHLIAKLKALLVRQRAIEQRGGSRPTAVSAHDLEARLSNVRYALPISQIALDIIQLSGEEDASMHKLAEVLSRDASLTVEVLRLANSQFYAGSAPKIMDVEQAVVRIGTRRLAELASATSALVGIANRTFTWLDASLLWRHSAASGIAMGLLLEHVRVSDHGGLFISALTQGLGRVVLGTLYPGMYELLTRSCAATGDSLLDQEDRTFPSRHADVMASVLAKWGFPPTVYQPLRHSLSPYDDLESLGDPLRSKVELCKIAAFVGRIAVGQFEPWDLVEPVPASVLARHNLHTCAEIVEQTRINLGELTSDDTSPQRSPTSSNALSVSATALGYVSLSSHRGDFLPDIFRSMGLAVTPLEPEFLATGGSAVVNCLDVPAKRLMCYWGSGLLADSRLVVTDRRHLPEFQSLGPTASMPISYAALSARCRAIAERPAAAVSQSVTGCPADVTIL